MNDEQLSDNTASNPTGHSGRTSIYLPINVLTTNDIEEISENGGFWVCPPRRLRPLGVRRVSRLVLNQPRPRSASSGSPTGKRVCYGT
jgi:hypothetical protein